MNDTDNNLGTDGTIPNSPDGIAVGHDPDGSNFNPEEDDTTTATDTNSVPDTTEPDTTSD